MTASAPRTTAPTPGTGRVIHLAHSPDSDDAFMFYGLATGAVDTEGLTYVHELPDTETLNQRARRAELEVTAVSIHAYAYLTDRYALLPHGASIGDRYGPRLVARSPMSAAAASRSRGRSRLRTSRSGSTSPISFPSPRPSTRSRPRCSPATRSSVSSSTKGSSRTPT